ncbi:MAG: lysylphosphatidylglycerol synthetase family protein [Prolixibacteraceae bacterium]|nr:lysylphosphatidylglycerol synthetase family protein [Prolixibacteraceae bacterium]
MQIKYLKKRFLAALKKYKIILQIILGLLFVLFGIYFIEKEQVEMGKVKDALLSAQPKWVILGLILVGIFILVQGLMYQQSFRAIHERIRLSTGIGLFLKRNLISVFLPAGVLTNMLFFNKLVEKKDGVNKTQIYFASSVFSFCSILSAVIIGIPALFWLLIKGSLSGTMIWGILLTSLLLVIIVYSVISIVKQGKVFQFLESKFPSFKQTLNIFLNQSFNRRKILLVLGLSILIEIIGVTQLFVSIIALDGIPSLEMAVIGYAIVLLLLMSSPFLRGIGAVEFALTYALVLFGLSDVLSLSVAFLFRFFEFWLVLILGLVALLSQKNNILIRVFPAVLLFLLGLVNIISGITPALPHRLQILKGIIPLDAINASVWLVVIAGIVMLAISIFLMRGLRNAWIVALVLTGISLITHLTKGIDWEEAIFSFVTFISLLYQRKQYFIRADLKLAKRSFLPVLAAVVGVMIFGTIGFYYLNYRYFNVNFSLWESFQEAISTFLLLNIDLTPATPFAKEFLYGMNILGGVTLFYIVYLLFRPLIQRPSATEEEDIKKAKELVLKYGKSSLDYFKTYYDKNYWFSDDKEGFVSFKTSQNYAFVLENPVCSDNKALINIIHCFDSYCRRNGLRSSYYRIPELNKSLYEKLGKKVLPIGEEAIVNIEKWTLTGVDKRGLRNAINKVTKSGYTFKATIPPQKDGFLQQLKAVSEEWLKNADRSEIVFSQGLFNEKELKNQVVFTIENYEKKVIGFVNLIPDFTKGEANFDLMRKTADAPNGTMDFLFVGMFDYLKETGFKTCNIGMVPMSGIENPENLQERLIKVAYEKIKQFEHYKSLREYKEKFKPNWHMMYLAYNDPYDLIYLPVALEQVIEP